jgi:hypothetical protein
MKQWSDHRRAECCLIGEYSNPSVYEQSVCEFSLVRDAQIDACFQFTSQFSLIRAPSSRKPIVVPGDSSQEVMGN